MELLLYIQSIYIKICCKTLDYSGQRTEMFKIKLKKSEKIDHEGD